MSNTVLHPFHQNKHSDSSWFIAMIQWLMAHVYAKLQRRIAMASMFAFILDCRCFDKNIVVRLNDTMKLSRGPSSLMFPIRFHDWVWSSTDTFITLPRGIVDIRLIKYLNLSAEEVRLAAIQLAERFPECVKYAGEDELVSDIDTVLQTAAEADENGCLIA